MKILFSLICSKAANRWLWMMKVRSRMHRDVNGFIRILAAFMKWGIQLIREAQSVWWAMRAVELCAALPHSWVSLNTLEETWNCLFANMLIDSASFPTLKLGPLNISLCSIVGYFKCYVMYCDHRPLADKSEITICWVYQMH